MILYIENPKDSTRKSLELVNDYSKVAGYKITGSDEAVPGLSVFPRGYPACRGTFGGRRKAVRDRLALQGGTGDFP